MRLTINEGGSTWLFGNKSHGKNQEKATIDGDHFYKPKTNVHWSKGDITKA